MAEGFWLFAICLFLYVLERAPYGIDMGWGPFPRLQPWVGGAFQPSAP